MASVSADCFDTHLAPLLTHVVCYAGPKVDEFFTVSIGGMVTVLNTSGSPLSPGDNVEWTFFTERGTSTGKRQKSGPRRIGVQLCSVSSPRAIGRVLTFAKAGEPFDLLIKQ